MGYVPLLEHAVLPLEGEELFSHNYFNSFCTLPSISLPPPIRRVMPSHRKVSGASPLVNGVSYRFTPCRRTTLPGIILKFIEEIDF